MPWSDPERKKEYERRYRAKNEEAIKARAKKKREANPERAKEYYAANKETIKARVRQWEKANPERVRARAAKTRERRRDEIRAYAKEYAKQYRIDNPGKHAEQLRAWRTANREKVREQNRVYYRQTRSRILAIKYGAPVELIEYLVARGRCDICGSTDRLVIDHCHATGVVRGLLCHQCNVSLGCMKDDPARMENAAKYLRATSRGIEVGSPPF